MKFIRLMKSFKQFFTNPVLYVILFCIIGIVVFFTCAPNSWVQAIGELAPDEHYEDGVLIRTVRGQDYIVTGYGQYQTLVPVAPVPSEE